jgi:ABC-2 type transport system permease protein
MWAIIKKEFKSYFLSPIGYIYIGIFLFITSLLFLVETFYVGSVEFNYMYSWTSLVITFTVPILTMRMFAE